MVAVVILAGFLAVCLLTALVGFGAFVIVTNRDRASEQQGQLDREQALAERFEQTIRSLAEQHERDQTEARAQLAEVLAAARKEREVLMDRIQRPDALADPVPFAEEPSPEPLTAGLDDDRADWDLLAAPSDS